MKNLMITFAVLCLLGSSSLLFAQDTAKESIYRACIDKAINKYESKSLMMDSSSPAIRRDAAIATLKASFYKSNKEQLVDQMIAQDLNTAGGEMNYFLVKSFGEFQGKNMDRAIAEILKANEGKFQEDSAEAYSKEKE